MSAFLFGNEIASKRSSPKIPFVNFTPFQFAAIYESRWVITMLTVTFVNYIAFDPNLVLTWARLELNKIPIANTATVGETPHVGRGGSFWASIEGVIEELAEIKNTG